MGEQSPRFGDVGNTWPRRLGADFHGAGTRFAIESFHATGVDLCLFDPDDDSGVTERRIPCVGVDGIWSVDVAGVVAGSHYGFRVHGPWDPGAGHLFNPSKLLLDPYGRGVDGTIRYDTTRTCDADGQPDLTDSAPGGARSVVIDDLFDWTGDDPPRRAWSETVIYEAHVKGMTMRHPQVPPPLRGTYLGLTHPAVLDHLTSLGVTAVEFLPVFEFVDTLRLHRLGKTNYWGYDPIGWFAPAARYATDGRAATAVREFKTMVKALHSAGLEVILDVVYNHTGETGVDGPTLTWRGTDHASSYRLAGDAFRYDDITGTGNTVDAGSPLMIRAVLDSMRYWVSEMRVDGFRFDLATVLTRDHGTVDPGGALIDAIGQDPVLAGTKLIAEPWDLGPGGYLVGGFPRRWREWNDQYRNGVREFWLRGGSIGMLTSRLAGSSDVFGGRRRGPTASINFVASHDGFPLADLVAFDQKHNEDNGEENRDGDSHNRSWNHGVEGPTDDTEIAAARDRSRRALFATLMVSLGVPMMLGGDELGRTQGGNNNAYCQDNEVSWFDWEDVDESFLAFARRLLRLRVESSALRRTTFLRDGEDGVDSDVEWVRLDGRPMEIGDWDRGRSVVAVLRGDASEDDLVVAVNGDDNNHHLQLPDPGRRWQPVVDSSVPTGQPRARVYSGGSRCVIEKRSVLVHRALGPAADGDRRSSRR